MSLNPSIILAGQQPDFVNVLAQSNQAAQQKNQFNRENALNSLYQEQGAQIAAGDQNALNALAGFDPKAALGIQHGRQNMRINEEELNLRRQSAAREAEAWAMQQDDRTKAEQAQKIQRGLVAAGQFVAAGDQAGLDRVLQQYGIDPVPLEQFPYLAAQYEGVLQAIEGASQFGKPPAPEYGVLEGQFYDKNNPGAGAQPIPGIQPAGPEWRAATPDEAATYGAAGGQINTKTGEFKRTPKDSNMTLESDGKGGFRFVQGPGGNNDPTDTSNPSSPAAMVASIDGILSDPALDTATGALAWTQGIPGTSQRRFGARVKQLDGQAFLQAFESLKGGGQITEIEGAKATQAIGRLDSAQKPEDYRQALTELRDILSVAAGRPVGWAQQQSAQPPEMPQISDDASYNALPSGTMFIAPDGTQRRKP